MEILIEATYKLKHTVTFEDHIRARDIRQIEVYDQDVHTELRDGTILHARVSRPEKDPVVAFYTILPKAKVKTIESDIKKPVKRKPKPVLEEAPLVTFSGGLPGQAEDQEDNELLEAVN